MITKGEIRLVILIMAFSSVNRLNAQGGIDFYSNGCNQVTASTDYNNKINWNNNDYELIFEDDFNGTSLDLTNWQRAYPWGRSLTSTTTGTGYEREYYLDDNVTVDGGGYLHLNTKIDPANRPVPYETSTSSAFFKYTSGMIFSKAKFKAGRFEMRGKIPYIDGPWPAFWLYGGDCAQEIDIFEFANLKPAPDNDPYSDSRNLLATYHKKYDCSLDDQCAPGVRIPFSANFSADFHTYALEWDENKIVWFVDGVSVRTVLRLWKLSPPPPGFIFPIIAPVFSYNDLETVPFNYTAFEPFPSTDTGMNLIINTAVGQDQGAFPAEFLIDYVKVYAKSECVTDLSLCEYDLRVPNIVSAKTITTSGSCNFDITAGQTLEMKATDEIVLNPGFSAEYNSDFDAHLSYCEDYQVKHYEGANSSSSNETATSSENISSQNDQAQKSGGDGLSVFPNPNEGKFTITNSKVITGVDVQNIIGKSVSFSQIIKSNSIEIDISNQPKGVYIIKIVCPEKTYAQKIIYN